MRLVPPRAGRRASRRHGDSWARAIQLHDEDLCPRVASYEAGCREPDGCITPAVDHATLRRSIRPGPHASDIPVDAVGDKGPASPFGATPSSVGIVTRLVLLRLLTARIKDQQSRSATISLLK